jgi:hypothetical protein
MAGSRVSNEVILSSFSSAFLGMALAPCDNRIGFYWESYQTKRESLDSSTKIPRDDSDWSVCITCSS